MVKGIVSTLMLLIVCAVLIGGLAACGGGGADIKSEVTTTTVGQQLLDLKKALDAGAITQKEYEAERKKILNRD